MSHLTDFDSLTPEQQACARLVLETLPHGINVVTGTVIAAVARTDTAFHRGATLWLSGTSGVHAEPAAISAATTAGDPAIHSLYLAMRRTDGGDPGYVTPCGECRQLVADLATYTGRPITIYSLNDRLDHVQVIEHTELLPHAYGSQRLRRAGAARLANPVSA
ncbi:hypothetical protein [Amycolatopsis magusensis]|uniref:hypothetical protein n=1 Tax=Amycolatopsis magusensis TaxID=882444 RepID=UPI0037A13266